MPTVTRSLASTLLPADWLWTLVLLAALSFAVYIVTTSGAGTPSPAGARAAAAAKRAAKSGRQQAPSPPPADPTSSSRRTSGDSGVESLLSGAAELSFNESPSHMAKYNKPSTVEMSVNDASLYARHNWH